jgi:hypothetical protein
MYHVFCRPPRHRLAVIAVLVLRDWSCDDGGMVLGMACMNSRILAMRQWCVFVLLPIGNKLQIASDNQVIANRTEQNLV